jgi:signal transduction histidine kinase
MRELAMTAADRILNPCHVISLTIGLLEQKGCPADATARALPRVKQAVERITRVVRQMATVSRYAPSEITKNIREIDLERAIADEPAADNPAQPPTVPSSPPDSMTSK